MLGLSSRQMAGVAAIALAVVLLARAIGIVPAPVKKEKK